jgi:replicative DNA helicase
MDTSRFINLDAERSVLGNILLKNGLMCDADLQPTDFYDLTNQAIFTKMLSLYKNNQSIDVVTLSESVKNQLTYLRDLADSATGTIMKSHVNIVKEKAKMRQLHTLLQTQLTELETGDKTSAEIAEAITNTAFEQYAPSGMITDEQMILKTMKMIDRRN